MLIKIEINDKVVNVVKKFFSGKKLIAIAIIAFVAVGSAVYSAVTLPHIFEEGKIISASEVNENFAALRAKLELLESNAGGAPVGTIIPWAGQVTDTENVAGVNDADEPIAGWILCDGEDISRTKYAELFAVLGVKWGAGNLIDTFNIPDLRGRFLRGVDHLAGIDPDSADREALFNGGNIGNAVGTYQLDEFKSHNHNAFVGSKNSCATGDGGTDGRQGLGENTDFAGGNETRPKNVYVNYLIKYK